MKVADKKLSLSKFSACPVCRPHWCQLFGGLLPLHRFSPSLSLYSLTSPWSWPSLWTSTSSPSTLILSLKITVTAPAYLNEHRISRERLQIEPQELGVELLHRGQLPLSFRKVDYIKIWLFVVFWLVKSKISEHYVSASRLKIVLFRFFYQSYFVGKRLNACEGRRAKFD